MKGIKTFDLAMRIKILLLILISAGLYLNSLNNTFTNWDDSMVYNNPEIRSINLQNIKNIFTPKKGITYQPIRVLSYAVDYYCWKLNPMGYRITNILFYVLICLIVFFLLKELSRNLRMESEQTSHFRVALFGGFLFAAHPVHVEAVTWLAARKEVLQGFFFFLAFYLYLKGRESESKRKIFYFVLVIFSFLLAILSKPSAIVFPGVILIYEITQRKNRWLYFIKEHWLFFISSILISIIFTLILVKVMIEAGGVKPYRGGNFFSNLLTSFYSFIYHIKLLIFTADYSAAYTIKISNPIISIRTFIFVGITFIIFILSLWSFKKTKVLFFSFLFFLVTIIPYLNLIPINILVADRYVFIASFSYCFLLGVLLNRIYVYKREGFSEGFFKMISFIIFFFLLAQYSFVTIYQNRVWKNSYTLWANALELYPESNTANALMGVVYMELGMDEEAKKYLEKAIQILPYDYQSRNNLGIIYGRLGEPEKALREFMIGLQLSPDNDTIKINLAIFYQRQKEYYKAEKILKDILKKYPDYDQGYFRLGLLYKEMGRYDDAISAIKKASEISPHIINPYEEIGNIYSSKLMDKEKAEFYYKKVIEMFPQTESKVEELRWMIHDLER